MFNLVLSDFLTLGHNGKMPSSTANRATGRGQMVKTELCVGAGARNSVVGWRHRSESQPEWRSSKPWENKSSVRGSRGKVGTVLKIPTYRRQGMQEGFIRK